MSIQSRYVIEQEPSTLDPAKSTTSPEATVQLQLFDGLVRLNDESEPEAALAKNGKSPMMVVSIPSIYDLI